MHMSMTHNNITILHTVSTPPLLLLSHLVLGEADQLFLAHYEAYGGNTGHVTSEYTHWFRDHVGVPQQHLVVYACGGCNQSERRMLVPALVTTNDK